MRDTEGVALIAERLDDPDLGLSVVEIGLESGYASDGIAAAVMAAASGRREIQSIQVLMFHLLVDMHRNNPAWCPLQVAYPGDLNMRLAFPSFDEAHSAEASETTTSAGRRPRKRSGKKTTRAAATLPKECPPR